MLHVRLCLLCLLSKMKPLSFPLGRNISESVTLSAKTPNKQKPKHYPPFNWFHQAFCHRDKKSNYIPVSLVPDRGRVLCHMWGKERGNFTLTIPWRCHCHSPFIKLAPPVGLWVPPPDLSCFLMRRLVFPFWLYILRTILTSNLTQWKSSSKPGT